MRACARALVGGVGGAEEQLTLAGGVRPPSDASERPASDWRERKTTKKVRGKRLEVRGWEDTAGRANSDLLSPAPDFSVSPGGELRKWTLGG